ncbi:MAG TPA: hypothetical protein VFH73_10265 [Polyangia bacterium]|jgi:uncharacterized protein with PQ loop repeat|nr:hypothetical protein [Polyangia bacterium]
MGVQAIGWLSSLILVATIAKQIHKQWREGASEGVSPWLFIGQMAASGGFTLYSWLVRDWVFIATNSLMFTNGVLGCVILTRNRRRARRRPSSPAEPVAASISVEVV